MVIRKKTVLGALITFNQCEGDCDELIHKENISKVTVLVLCCNAASPLPTLRVAIERVPLVSRLCCRFHVRDKPCQISITCHAFQTQRIKHTAAIHPANPGCTTRLVEQGSGPFVSTSKGLAFIKALSTGCRFGCCSRASYLGRHPFKFKAPCAVIRKYLQIETPHPPQLHEIIDEGAASPFLFICILMIRAQ